MFYNFSKIKHCKTLSGSSGGSSCSSEVKSPWHLYHSLGVYMNEEFKVVTSTTVIDE